MYSLKQSKQAWAGIDVNAKLNYTAIILVDIRLQKIGVAIQTHAV